MQLYLFRFLDGRGRNSQELRLQACDDEEALQLAGLSTSFGAIEVWRDDVRVGLTTPGSQERNIRLFRRSDEAGRK
ncbi:MAG: hypothetical protein J7559_00450 [Cohnella sp.]|nr:hypothetical protein [Cohnella sp.]